VQFVGGEGMACAAASGTDDASENQTSRHNETYLRMRRCTAVSFTRCEDGEDDEDDID
jgi:hypothetical protein